MTARLALSCFLIFSGVYVVCTEIAFRLIVGFNPRISFLTALFPATLYLLVLTACVALASTITVRSRVLVLAATLALALWVLGPTLVDLIMPRGSSFSISLGGVPVIVEGERTDFGMKLNCAQLIVRIVSAATLVIYLSLLQRRA